MATVLNFQITDVGIAAVTSANNNGPKINITTVKLGSVSGYTPTSAAAGLRGNTLYTGPIADYSVDAQNQMSYSLRFDQNVGDFSFGEIGLYLDTGEMFAVASLAQPQEKVAAKSGSPGNVIFLIARLVLDNIAPTINFIAQTLAHARIVEIATCSALAPGNNDNTPNAFSIQELDDGGNPPLATRDTINDLWTFTTHRRAVITGSISAATTTSLNSSAIASNLVTQYAAGKYIMQITSGALKGQCRYVTNTGTTNQVSWTNALTGTPAVNDTFEIIQSDYSILSNLGDFMLTKSVAGGANVTLTTTEANYKTLNFTGALTANINVIVPTTYGRWTILNNTTGAYTLTVKTSAGSGIAVTQGKKNELMCDGTNVILQQDDFVSVALTGTSTAITAAADTNTAQIATTAFVIGQAASVAPLMAGTAAVGTSLRYARQDHVHPTDTTRSPVASPTFTGTPAAPTASPGTNTTQLATTAFVTTAVSNALSNALATATPLMDGTVAVGTATKMAREDHRHPTDSTRAPLDSPSFTGTVTLGTVASNFTVNAVGAGEGGQFYLAKGPSSALGGDVAVDVSGTAFRVFAGGANSQGFNVDLNACANGAGSALWHSTNFDPSLKANLASPTFLGIPAAPTAATGTETTQLATTAFVIASVHSVLTKNVAGGADITLTDAECGYAGINFTGALTGNINIIVPSKMRMWTMFNRTTGNYTLGIKTATSSALLVAQGYQSLLHCNGSSMFLQQTDYTNTALMGVPTTPTAATGTSTTQIASTAFVQQEISNNLSNASPPMDGAAAIGTSTRLARQDHVHPTDTTRAPIASPSFTGVPLAPTPSATDSSTQVATTAFVGYAAPPGQIAHFARDTAPSGWLKANGAAISRATYANLFAAIGTLFGTGDGSTTFNVPDLRGEFLRGWDDARGVDGSRTFASVQTSQNLSHNHAADSVGVGDHAHGAWTDTQGWHGHHGNTYGVGDHQHDSGWGEAGYAPYGYARTGAYGSHSSDWDNQSFYTSPAGGHGHSFDTDGAGSHGHNIGMNGAGGHAHTINVYANGGSEARPRNVALLVCIKY